jgi:hypothetical protein
VRYVTETDGTYVRSLRDRRQERTSAAHEGLRALRLRFVEPDGYPAAAHRLAGTGCVVLVGPRGGGRHTAARMLLYGLPGPYAPVRDEPSEPDSPDEPLLDHTAVAAGDRLVLDLSGADDATYRNLVNLLVPYLAAVRERDARLVVVLRSDQERLLPPELAGLAVAIARPDGRTVLVRHLKADGVPREAEQLDDPVVRRRLAQASVRDVAELARLIRAARQRASRHEGFADWLAAAMRALWDRDADVAGQLAALDGGRPRALLLTTAMLSGVSSDAVHDAAARLLAIVEHPPDDRPLLERPSVAEQFAAIGVGPGAAGGVEFDELDYDRAVRSHFWTNYPDLRDVFRDWVDAVVRLPALRDHQRDVVVRRFAAQALRVGRPDDLIELVTRWSSAAELMPLAGHALELGLAHRRLGGRFRRQLYVWATRDRLPAGLVDVLVTTCAGALAVTRPAAAVVRLHQLARRHRGTVSAALVDLVRDDRRLFSLLVRRLSGHWPADADLFAALADPARLVDSGLVDSGLVDSGLIDDAVTGWHAVLVAGPSVDALRGWLTAAVDDRWRDQLLNVLVDACAPDVNLYGRLYVVVRDWAREPAPDGAVRSATAAALFDKIDSAQGVET